MERFFAPRGVVVFGVSPGPGNLAARVIHNLVAWRFPGKVVAVGRRAGEVGGLPILTELDAEAAAGCDLAVVLTPAAQVAEVVRRCGALGIGQAIVESSGFSELRGAGDGLEAELALAAREAGVRLVGPNCVGLIRFDRGLVTTFAAIEPEARAGDAAIVSQSGGVMLCAMRALDGAGAPANWLVSIGNKLDLDEVEVTAHLLERERPGRLLCYLESIPRGRALCDVLRRSEAPVVVHKVNRSARAALVASSHTAALANDDAVVTAALTQAGAVRARDSREATLAVAATRLPPLRGPRLAVLSRSGGHAVIAADACAEEGLELPPLSEALLGDLAALQRETVIRRSNPLDFGDVFDFSLMARIVERALADDELDALALILVWNPASEREAGLRLIVEAAELSRRAGKPLAIAAVTGEPLLAEARARADWPVFGTPEEALRALGLLLRREEARARARQPLVPANLDREAARAALAGPGRVLSVERSLALLRAAGLPISELARPGDAGRLGFPLVAKHSADSAEVVHKAGAGLVRAGLADRVALATAAAELTTRAAALGLGGEVLVQRQQAGVELFLGARRDPSFGPIVLFGAGGSLVELLGDVALWPWPFTLAEVEHLWARSTVARLLRDRLPPQRLAAWLAGLGELLEAFPEVVEVDVNPVIVGEEGAWAVDSRVLRQEGGGEVTG